MAALTAHRGYLDDVLARQAERRLIVDPDHALPPLPDFQAGSSSRRQGSGPSRATIQPSKANVINYVAGEESIRNDYAAWYGVSGEAGANYILGAGEGEVCEEYVWSPSYSTRFTF